MTRLHFSLAASLTAVCLLVCWVPREARAQSASFRRGDSNSDGRCDVSDPVHSLGFLFIGGPGPTCMDAADSNDSGELDLSDAVYTLGFLFLGTPPPDAPFPGCGVDTTEDALDCEAYAPCVDAKVYVNVQVDAELEDVDGLARLTTLLKERSINTTIYVTADYANRNGLTISDLFQQGFEIALHGYYSGEQLASMTYEEQKDLLSRAKIALEGCKPCGTWKDIVGFRPQYFSQNEDTYRVLDELGLTYNSGFKAHELFLPGHEWDEAPYAAPGHNFAAVPISTIPYGTGRPYACDLSCASALKMTGAQWREFLLAGLEQSLVSREPLVILLHNYVTGDNVKYDYWQPFVDFLDAATGQVTFVSSKELVDLYPK
jgi:peptidoglycan/xylan/chitin deacetylase (PgdA/CDA1 family)